MSTQIVKNIRPTCTTENCNKLAQDYGRKRKDGSRTYRKYCSTCHVARMKNFNVKKKTISNNQYPVCSIKNCQKSTTLLGTNHKGELKFSEFCELHGGILFHLQFRKTYCENIDSRLGFKCTTTIHYDPPLPAGITLTKDYGYPQPMLQVDHIDGNPYNEPEDGSNFQTLCACCHAYKTWKSGDAQTAGRKTLKAA